MLVERCLENVLFLGECLIGGCAVLIKCLNGGCCNDDYNSLWDPILVEYLMEYVIFS